MGSDREAGPRPIRLAASRARSHNRAMSATPPTRILLGVTGGIAAYKSAELVRRLVERGAEVQVVMTSGAQRFVTPLTFQALSGRPVRSDLWDESAEAAMGHIELARWASHVLVAPASADFIARLAHGLANDLLTTLCLATDAPIAVAPAMNRLMWANPATQANVATLRSRKVAILGPGEGGQACGETGPGRMLEPAEIIAALWPGVPAVAAGELALERDAPQVGVVGLAASCQVAQLRQLHQADIGRQPGAFADVAEVGEQAVGNVDRRRRDAGQGLAERDARPRLLQRADAQAAPRFG